MIMIIQEENKLRLAAENSSTLNGADLKDKKTALDEVKAQQEQYESENKDLAKQVGKWKRINIVAIIVLIIVLLFSLTTVLVATKYKVNTYEVVLNANEIVVDKEDISSMTTNELREATKNKYIANCMEFYYDVVEDKYYDVSNDNTTYYSVGDLRSAVYGNPITYSVESVEKVNKAKNNSQTKILSRSFSYGLLDGSAQMSPVNSTNLIFSGYTRTLLDSYMNSKDLQTPMVVTRQPAYFVVDKKIEVTEEMINQVIMGIEDFYMANTDETEQLKEVTYDDYWYGFYVEDNKLYYLTSHDCNVGKNNVRQALTSVDITDLVEENLEDYLGEDITVSFDIPLIANKGTTVVYLNTNNTVKDSFYIAYEQELY